ncbi:MAG: nucleoside diphosphate kinase regulator [Desulfuromonadales bacterium]
MSEKTTYMTEFDIYRLEAFLEAAKKSYRFDRNVLESLQEEIEQSRIVNSRQIPPDVVTINSRIRLCDLDADQEMILTLVLPAAANFAEGRLSVASPIGTAILGYAAGDTIEWNVPSGTKRIRIEEILYQPEAAGDYHL